MAGRLMRFTVLAAITLLLLSAVLPFVKPATASALSGSQFRAGRIIDDAVFYDYKSMSASQIQSFLNSKVPDCDAVAPNPKCLKDYSTSTRNIAAESGLCNNVIGYSSRSAANIIYDVSRACGVSPKVLIVLLQKEQGLVTSTAPTSTMYRIAMGYGCPDSATVCNSKYYGFFNQVYNAAWQYKKYRASPDGFNFIAGRNNRIYYNPDPDCGSSIVYIENQATAGLYNYTPYQPNSATLSKGLGETAPCGAYGNKNFWWYFNIWFGSTYATPFFRVGDNPTVYIYGANNSYYGVPSNQVLKTYGYGYKANYIAQVTSTYTSGMTYRGSLPLIARYDGSDEIYLMDDHRSHHFPDPSTLNAYGYSVGEEADLAGFVYNYLIHSVPMRTVLTQTDAPEVYLVGVGKKQHITSSEAYNTLGSPVYSSRPSVGLTSAYVNDVPNGAPILLNGSLVKTSDSSAYYITNGSTRQAFSASAVADLGPVPDYTAHSSVINQLTSSGSTAGKLVKDSSNNLFIMDRNKKLSVTSGQLANLGMSGSDFVAVNNAFLDRFPTTPMTTLIKINGGDPVYSIINDKLYRVFSGEDFVGLGYSWSNVVNVNGSTSILFTNAGNNIFMTRRLVRIGSTDTVYLINSSFSKRVISSRAIFDNYGFNMRYVRSTTSAGLAAYTGTDNLTQVVKDSLNNYWLVDSKVKRQIDSTMRGATYYNINSAPSLDDSILTRIQSSSALTNFIKATGSSRVYKIENGQKRWLTTPTSFSVNGGDWDNVRVLSPSYVASIPSGANL